MPINAAMPTLQDVLNAVEQRESGTRKRDLKSAVTTFCRAVGKAPAEILALPKDIRALREGGLSACPGYLGAALGQRLLRRHQGAGPGA